MFSASAHADMFKPGVKDQIDLGQRAAKEIRKEKEVLPDTDPRVKEVRRIGAKVVSMIDAKERKNKPFKYSFDVLVDKEVNAFALPGGPLFINTGLLDKLTTEDQIAGVFAHEITHANKEHWANAYGENMKRRIGISLGLVIFKANENIVALADIADTLGVMLPYSRANENQADSLGYELMVAAGYNPLGMVDTFKLLMKESGGKGKSNLEEWVSTHPDNKKRIDNIEKRIAQSKTVFPPQTPRKK